MKTQRRKGKKQIIAWIIYFLQDNEPVVVCRKRRAGEGWEGGLDVTCIGEWTPGKEPEEVAVLRVLRESVGHEVSAQLREQRRVHRLRTITTRHEKIRIRVLLVDAQHRDLLLAVPLLEGAALLSQGEVAGLRKLEHSRKRDRVNGTRAMLSSLQTAVQRGFRHV